MASTPPTAVACSEKEGGDSTECVSRYCRERRGREYLDKLHTQLRIRVLSMHFEQVIFQVVKLAAACRGCCGCLEVAAKKKGKGNELPLRRLTWPPTESRFILPWDKRNRAVRDSRETDTSRPRNRKQQETG